MGFHSTTVGSLSWARISDGKIIQKLKDKTETSMSRINKMGVLVHEAWHDAFEGHLTNVSTKDSDFGTQWLFEFKDGDDTIIITADYDKRYARTFLVRLLNSNLDFSKQIKIKPYRFTPEDKDKDVTGVAVFQGGVKIEPGVAQESIPMPSEITIKKVKTWDYTKQMEWFEQQIIDKVLPKLPKRNNQIPNVTLDSNGFINIEDDIEEPNLYDGLE